MTNMELVQLILDALQKRKGLSLEEAVEVLEDGGCGWRHGYGEKELDEEWDNIDCQDCIAHRMFHVNAHNLKWLYDHDMLDFDVLIEELERIFEEDAE